MKLSGLMKTHEEGYALGWADAIYVYESKQRKQMSTLAALMSLVDSYKCDRGTRWAIRDAIESALRRAEPEQAEPVARLLEWCGPIPRPQDTTIARTFSEFPEKSAFPHNQSAYWRNGTALYTSPPKREPLPEREIKDICHMNGWDDSYQSMRFARAIERAHGIGDE